MFYTDQWPVFEETYSKVFSFQGSHSKSVSMIHNNPGNRRHWETQTQAVMLDWSRDSEGISELPLKQLILPSNIFKFSLVKSAKLEVVQRYPYYPWNGQWTLSHKLLARTERVTLCWLSPSCLQSAESVETNCCKFGRCAWLTVRETQAESTCNILPSSLPSPEEWCVCPVVK